MNRALGIGVAALGVVFLGWCQTARAYDVESIQANGDPANRIDLVILGDGYRDVDQTKLTNDVNSFLSEFWQQTPYAEYRSYFNVKLVHVISVENGADNGSYGAVRDTALGAYYNCSGIDRLLCVDYGTVFSVANSHVPEYDHIFVIVNDPKYGGAGGSVAVFSVHALAGQIAIHEMGHTLGGLADEYEDAYPGYPNCGSDCPEPNATNHSVRDEVKWNLWVDGATPVPTPETAPYNNVPGVFEGCRYQTSGLYRPRMNCMMRALGVPFCEVCAEALIRSIYNRVDPIDSSTPSSPVALSGCQSVDLGIVHLTPDPDSMNVTWSVDGAPVQTGSSTLTVAAYLLGDGAHTVLAEVEDGTSLVRNDPSHLLLDQASWVVNVSGAGQGGCLIGGTCYPAGTFDPANPCRECNPAVDPNAWTPDDSNSCDDGLFCNGTATCVAGVCQVGGVPCEDDGLACTATCDEVLDVCNLLQPGFCLIAGACVAAGTPDPGNPCRACQPGLDPSGYSPDDSNSCDDGIFCNGAEHCQAGACSAGAPPCSDDGLDCTTTCDEAQHGCNPLQPGFCLIGGVCWTAGVIDPANPCRECQPGVDPFDYSPDDSNSCDDGAFCNGPETCQAGVCAVGAAPCTDDGLDCTTPCDEALDACNRLVPDTCLIVGECQSAGAANSLNPCLSCQPGTATDEWTANDAAACDDDRPCTTGDHCQVGVCTGDLIAGCCTQNLDCDDALACTTDVCDPVASQCSHELSAGTCLIGGVCYGQTDPDPANSCRTCQPDLATDSFSDADGVACEDGDACTSGEVCQAGTCSGGQRICSDACPCDPDGGSGADGGDGADGSGVTGGCGCGAGGPAAGWIFGWIGLLALASRSRRRRG